MRVIKPTAKSVVEDFNAQNYLAQLLDEQDISKMTINYNQEVVDSVHEAYKAVQGLLLNYKASPHSNQRPTILLTRV